MISRYFTDMTGRNVEISAPLSRIISLVPSQTELLYELGLDKEVIGITKFCVHPESWFRTKTRIGGTKQLNIDKIKELKPDLLIANKEENTQEQIEELARDFPVWISDIKNRGDALKMITEIGQLVNKEEKANKIAHDISDGFRLLRKANKAKSVAYFIWRDPWMCTGGDTFISSMIEAMGWENMLKHQMRYPVVDLADMAKMKPELILLSSEPYPFKQKHIDEIKAVIPASQVLLVDGEMFSWYGSRMCEAIPYIAKLAETIN